MAIPVKKALEAAGKKLYPKKIPKDLARRAKDIGKRFKTPKELKDHAKTLGIKDVDKVYRRKEGRKKLIELVAQQERATRPSVWTQPVTARQAATGAGDVISFFPRAVTALGGIKAPATAGNIRKFGRGAAWIHAAVQAGKGARLLGAFGEGKDEESREKLAADRREALRRYGGDAEFMGQQATDLSVPQNLLRAAEAGFWSPAESTYASVQAKRLMDEQAEDWEKRDLDPETGKPLRREGHWWPFGRKSVWAQTGRMKEEEEFPSRRASLPPLEPTIDPVTGEPVPEDKRWSYQRPHAQRMADTDGDGIISEEERAAALEAKPTLGRSRLHLMAQARGAAGRKEYSSKLPPSLRSLADDDLFLGGAGDPEWDTVQRGSIDSRMETEKRDEKGKLVMVPPKKAFMDRMYGEEGQYTQYTAQKRQDKEETGAFSKEDRAAFLKAAKDDTLITAFDVNNDGVLSREEKKLFFDKEQGFKARRDEIMKAGADLIPAPEPEGMPPVDPREAPLGVDPATGDPILPEPEAPEPPPTTGDYADMMRHTIETATDIGERNEVMRTIRDEMIAQDLTSFEEFNQIGRQMLEEAPARKAAAHVAYLRSPAGSDWVDTPGLDSLAALQKAPFGRGTALEGSVGKLTDESRQLESIGGRQRRKARELEGMGHRSVAAQVRAGAPRRPLMSQRDRLELEKKKKALAAEQAAAQALISKGEENINANIVS